MSQLALPLQLADHAVFETYLAVGNEPVVDYLCSLSESAAAHGAWLWGPTATGKSHLLQAACERFGDRAVYVPLRELDGAGPGLLDGLGSRDLISVDDIVNSVTIGVRANAIFIDLVVAVVIL